MPDLRETLEMLVAAFVEDVLAAIKDIPLDELLEGAARRANGERTDDDARLPRKPRRPKREKMPPKPRSAAVSRAPETAIVVDEIGRFFEQRGRKGATASQVDEHLRASGFVGVDGAVREVIGLLVEQGSIRDAGFRRTTGTGTAPVYVVPPAREPSPTV